MVINKSENEIVKGQKSNHKNPVVLNNNSLPTATIEISNDMLQRADSNHAQVKMMEPVKVKIIQMPSDVKVAEAYIKVTFKRGSSVKDVPPAESRLVFKKFKLRIFENQTYDTSAYASGAEVEADRKFRIKF
jgi:hypothetical protein